MVEKSSESSGRGHLLDSSAFLNSIEIVGEREGGLVDAYIPLQWILTEEVPVDNLHVTELAESMTLEAASRGRSGQLSAILVGDIHGEPRLPIIDGFHRTSALKGTPLGVYGTIRPNSTWEEVYDLRILAASSHRSVKFARIVEWIDAAWELSPWSAQINSLQAFSLVTNDKVTGKNLGVDPTDIPSIREWVGDKCAKWNLAAASVHQHLQTARQVDPELIKEARENVSGRSRRGSLITPNHLRVIGGTLANDHERQRLVAEVTKREKLSVSETQSLASVVAGSGNLARAKELLETGLWRGLGAPTRPIGRPSENGARIKERKSSAEILDILRHSLLVNEIELAKAGLDLAVLRARYLPDQLSESQTFAPPAIKGIEQPKHIWSNDDMNAFENYMSFFVARTRNEFLPALGEAQTDLVLGNVVERFKKDMREGGISFVKIDFDQKDLINRLLTLCVRDELSHRNDRPHTKSIPTEETDPTIISVLAAEYLLPELEAVERRAFILGSVFRLSSFTIARLINVELVDVIETFKTVENNLNTKVVRTRSPGSSILSPTAIDESSNSFGLTDVETNILLLVSMGMSNEEIARSRFISQETVKSHLRHLLEKTGAKNRAGLVSQAYETGLIHRAETRL